MRHYQNWLFFGLLHELLDDLYEMDDYITDDEDLLITRITTTSLRSILRRWKKTRLPAIQDTDPEFPDFKACLEEVWRILELTERFFVGHGPRLALQIDFIAALAELFTNVIKKQNRNFQPRNEAGQACNWLAVSCQGRPSNLQKCIDTVIDFGGWCEADVQMRIDQFATVEAWHYVRHFKVREDSSMHRTCGQLKCDVATARSSSILPSHVTDECMCESFEADAAELAETYEQRMSAVPASSTC